MENNRIFYSFWIILSTLFLNGCDEAGIKDEALSLIQTEVIYHQSMVLPEGAMLEVRLKEISINDGPSAVISLASRAIKNRPPFLLQLAIPQHLIKNNHHYDIQASITVDAKVYFISTTTVNPFEVGVASPIQITVVRSTHE
jgi:uncharacterized lipoprotein YbaY